MSYPASAEIFLKLCAAKQMALTFDDVLLEPQYSEIESRSTIDLTTNITPLRKLQIPLIAANMDTVCESKMAIAIGKLGGLGVLHRYMNYEKQLGEVSLIYESGVMIAAAVGVKNGIVQHVKDLAEAGCSLIVIDIAHGHHKLVGDLLVELKALELISLRDNLPVEFIAGNVASPQGIDYLVSKGADCVKVGVGPGGACSTREVTGHGMPQLTAIASTALSASKYNKTIIADGGLKNSGDIVKALAAGANTVMCGYLFAGTLESPGEIMYDNDISYKEYRGMASGRAQKQFYGNDPDAPEGINTRIPYKGEVAGIVKQLVAGIRSGFSYSGSNNLEEFRTNASWIQITNAGKNESKTIID